ncbi:MAG: glycosyl transferase family 28 [Oleiphilaceae bacterium]|nr:glycosyl transferase family 28 [Oleiphilaceae bacterium]
MIFVTVGTQLSFNRLVQMVDLWAGANRQEPVFIQSGKSSFKPLNCECVPFTEHAEWEDLFHSANKVISHAGMGTILKGLAHAKPLIITPRQAALGEHRNDHQRATAARFRTRENITVVNDAEELAIALSRPVKPLLPEIPEANPNLKMLLAELNTFIQVRQQA